MTTHAPESDGTPKPQPRERSAGEPPRPRVKILLVDDEERFRQNLAQRLRLRGYAVSEAGDGVEAIRAVRQGRPDVVLLDRKMPRMEGEEALKEIKKIAPEVQVVILTGHASIESATQTGRLDAFAYLSKPCETDELIETVERAFLAKGHAMARAEIPHVKGRTLRSWLWGTQGWRPAVMLVGALLFGGLYLAPAPRALVSLLGAEKSGAPGDAIAGYADYGKMKPGETIAQYYSGKNKRTVKQPSADGSSQKRPLNAPEAARTAMVMLGILLIAALFWATGTLPIGMTALLVGVLMYLFNVFPPDQVAKAFAKDAVVFILGVLALAAGIAKSGLDKRIGLLLLGTSRSLTAFLFIFCPLLAMSASFLSEHALVAFIAPVLMLVYMSGIRAAGLKVDRALAVLFILSICFVANQGGPGSPAAGGRNAVMVGILADYGVAPSFGQWVKYGFPFVPVMALVIALYFFLVVKPKVLTKGLNVAEIVRREVSKIGPMTRDEYVTAGVLVVVILLWITASDALGMGGPALLGVVALAVARIMTWKDVNKISWDVVALYAAACAMGTGLASTGVALWMAHSFLSLLPDALSSGAGLCVAASLFTGVLTQIMSDGATVSALGPIAVPMASVSGTHPWMVGFATAFASSFANALIIGTPNNAIAYTLARDPDTGEQLVTLGDFMKHGLAVTALSLLVLWGWVFYGYWPWIGFE